MSIYPEFCLVEVISQEGDEQQKNVWICQYQLEKFQ